MRLTLDEACKIGLEKVLVTCNAENLRSAWIIEKNGGVLEGRNFENFGEVGEPVLDRDFR